jgi:uncharacterized membrane protein YgcG
VPATEPLAYCSCALPCTNDACCAWCALHCVLRMFGLATGYESSRVKLDGLGQVYSDAIAYLDAQQGAGATGAALRYEIVWVDNGSSDAERSSFRRMHPELERTVLLSRNVGLYGAMNAAWFDTGGCTAPYVLSLEDDWVPRRPPPHGAWSPHHISDSIAILRSDSSVGGVRLKDDWTDEVIPLSPWQGGGGGGGGGSGSSSRSSSSSGGGGSSSSSLPGYRTQTTDVRNGMVWGSFTTVSRRTFHQRA